MGLLGQAQLCHLLSCEVDASNAEVQVFQAGRCPVQLHLGAVQAIEGADGDLLGMRIWLISWGDQNMQLIQWGCQKHSKTNLTNKRKIVKTIGTHTQRLSDGNFTLRRRLNKDTRRPRFSKDRSSIHHEVFKHL